MGRLVLHWVCVFALVALPVVGCSDESTGTGGTGGSTGDVFPCTEQGILDAIAEGGGPHRFDCAGAQTVTTEEEIVIDNNVILDGEGNLTVDGGIEDFAQLDDHRVFSVAEGVTAELRGLTVTGGRNSAGRGRGSGIENSGTLTLADSTVSGNSAEGAAGILNEGTLMLTNSTVSGNSGGGGGVFNDGTMTLSSSMVSGNERDGIFNVGTMTLSSSMVSGNSNTGVGIRNTGTMTIRNSTVSGVEGLFGILNDILGTLTMTNSTVSGNEGFGIGNDGNATLTMTNSTVSDNSGGGISSDGTLTITNSLVVGDCELEIASNGYNIESPGNTCGFDPDGTDQVDVTEGQLNLDPLQDNGGPTMTHALLPGSVAIDVIPADMCEVNTDQRGFPRDSMCDVGAFEVLP